MRKVTSLAVRSILRSAAEQLKGRAGRTQPGTVYRLYSREDYEGMAPSLTAEVLARPLELVVVNLLAAGVDPLTFDWIQAPSRDALLRAMGDLAFMGAITCRDIGSGTALQPAAEGAGGSDSLAEHGGVGDGAVGALEAAGADDTAAGSSISNPLENQQQRFSFNCERTPQAGRQASMLDFAEQQLVELRHETAQLVELGDNDITITMPWLLGQRSLAVVRQHDTRTAMVVATVSVQCPRACCSNRDGVSMPISGARPCCCGIRITTPSTQT